MSRSLLSAPFKRLLLQHTFHPTQLPPTFLLPLRANLTTTATTTDPNPPESAFSTRPPINTTRSHTSIPPPQPKLQRPTPPFPVPSPTSTNTTPSPTPPLLAALAAQPPHYITAHIHSHPYLLTLGDTLRLPFRLPSAPPGTIIRLNRASLIGSRDYTFRGAPWIDERFFIVRARVVGVEGEPMRVIEKTRRRRRRVKTVKSKMRFTVLRVCEVRVLPDGQGEEVEQGREDVVDG